MFPHGPPSTGPEVSWVPRESVLRLPYAYKCVGLVGSEASTEKVEIVAICAADIRTTVVL